MSINVYLLERSNNKCELCSSSEGLKTYEVPPVDTDNIDKAIVLCGECESQITKSKELNPAHWRCLNDSMWSEYPVVQVMAWRVLDLLSSEGWAQDLKSQMYMEEAVQDWAEAMKTDPNTKPTLDSNGTQLEAGDNVTLIKDLVVKGANFTAKRGTMVRNISLTNDPKHIEGRVNGTHIVLVAAFLKKQ